VIVRPFKALRPRKDLVDRVACPPYDVVTEEEVRSIVSGNPYSFLNIVRAEATFEKGVNPYDEKVYRKARKNLERFVEEGILLREDSPAFYIYRQTMGEHQQTGIVACVSVDEYLANKIKKHELTRQDKEDDRTRHIVNLKANTGPVFLTYRACEELDRFVQEILVKDPAPEYDFEDENGVNHTVWVIKKSDLTEAIADFFREIDCFYIADGHHRAAAAVRAREHFRNLNPHHRGDEEYNFFMAVIFPHDQLQILPYNRVVKDFGGMNEEKFIERVNEKFELEKAEKEPFEPQERHLFGMYMGRWYALRAKPGTYDPDDPVDSLDVQILQKNLLAPILKIEDPRRDSRIDFIGGIKGVEYLQKLVDEGKYALAFSMYPTSVEELMKVADAGMIMPPKSTWFEPKLRSGLFVHELED